MPSLVALTSAPSSFGLECIPRVSEANETRPRSSAALLAVIVAALAFFDASPTIDRPPLGRREPGRAEGDAIDARADSGSACGSDVSEWQGEPLDDFEGQLEFFREHGYVFLPRAIEGDVLERAQAAFTAAAVEPRVGWEAATDSKNVVMYSIPALVFFLPGWLAPSYTTL